MLPSPHRLHCEGHLQYLNQMLPQPAVPRPKLSASMARRLSIAVAASGLPAGPPRTLSTRTSGGTAYLTPQASFTASAQEPGAEGEEAQQQAQGARQGQGSGAAEAGGAEEQEQWVEGGTVSWVPGREAAEWEEESEGEGEADDEWEDAGKAAGEEGAGEGEAGQEAMGTGALGQVRQAISVEPLGRQQQQQQVPSCAPGWGRRRRRLRRQGGEEPRGWRALWRQLHVRQAQNLQPLPAALVRLSLVAAAISTEPPSGPVAEVSALRLPPAGGGPGASQQQPRRGEEEGRAPAPLVAAGGAAGSSRGLLGAPFLLACCRKPRAAQ